VTTDEVRAALRDLIADRLARKPAEVTPESRLVDDLGADSLDFVDLVFAIEKRFGVSLRDDELDVLSQLDFSSPEVMRDGFLTRDVLARLTPALPALRDVEDPERVTPAAVFGLVTVGALAAMIERRRGGRG
jgi:acyl carrier protein